MGKLFAELDERLTEFIVHQPVYFVATAPILNAPGAAGHVNISPKGYQGSFAVLGPRTVAYLDLTGSGAETIAHVRQNGRITIMFCSFAATPKILRLYGTGRVVLPGETGFPDLFSNFSWAGSQNGDRGGHRAIIVVELDRIAGSCGYGVPMMDLRGERDLLIRWSQHKSPDDVERYRAERNAVSIDGLPALATDGELAITAPGRR